MFAAEILFGSYLAGLIEGDGSILVRVGKSEKVSPAIIFTFHEREKPLFEKPHRFLTAGVSIKKVMGFECKHA
jgi:hypothetical protein